MKFSIIVPVYNTFNYLSSCLESILKQTYDNFEVIVVDDGSTDNSYKIMEEYSKLDKRFKKYKKKNGGVSSARNFWITKATGDYIIFVDSDDTINTKLLEVLNSKIIECDDIDLIKYNMEFIGSSKSLDTNETFNELNGEEAFLKLYTNSLFVCPVCYAYKRTFWLKNNFSYEVGRIHEDYGLTPNIVLKANKVSAIDFVGYNYYLRENSIMTDNSLEKVIKKNEDCLYHYEFLLKCSKSIKDDYERKIFVSYISYVLINRTDIIKDKKILKEYIQELNKRNIGNNLIDDTIPRKIKKLIFKISPSLFIKIFVK